MTSHRRLVKVKQPGLGWHFVVDLPSNSIPGARPLPKREPTSMPSLPLPPSLPTWLEQTQSEEYTSGAPFAGFRSQRMSTNDRTSKVFTLSTTRWTTGVDPMAGQWREATPRTLRQEPALAPVRQSSDLPARPSGNPFATGAAHPRVSVIIPARNEAANLPFVLPRIPAWVHEIILVDGRSTDGTSEVAQALQPDIHIIQEEKPGKGTALRTGFAAATGDIIVMLDADGSTDPAEIPAFVGGLLSGADFAKGSRFAQGAGTADMSAFRRLGNWGFVWMVRLMFGGSYTDLCYGYNAFWKHVLDRLELDGDGFEIETMMNVRALRAGLRVVEVPSFEAERLYGSSNLRAIPDGWRVMKTLFREWLSPREARPLWRRPQSLAAEREEYAQSNI